MIKLNHLWLWNKIMDNRTEKYKDIIGYSLSIAGMFLFALIIVLPIPKEILSTIIITKQIIAIYLLLSVLSLFIIFPIANYIDKKEKINIDKMRKHLNWNRGVDLTKP